MERTCPLCDHPNAHVVELPELKARRIECLKCTTYEITAGLETILADPNIRPRLRYLFDAAPARDSRRAMPEPHHQRKRSRRGLQRRRPSTARGKVMETGWIAFNVLAVFDFVVVAA